MTDKFGGYRELQVWHKAIDLVTHVYEITKTYPQEEKFGLISQTQRAAVSIPSNIAEGQARAGKQEFVHFLRISYSSAAELETQIIIANNLGYLDQAHVAATKRSIEEVMKMLAGLIKSLHSSGAENC